MLAALHVLTIGVLALSAILVIVCVWCGPSVFERTLALETLALILVGTLLLYVPLAVDAALGLAIFSFVSTVLLAYFLGEGEFPNE